MTLTQSENNYESAGSLNKLNVLWIIADQLRADCLGIYGNPVIQTPNIDRLGSQGSVIDGVQVTTPLCTPSRASMITSLYPHQHGAWNLGVALSETIPTVEDYLSTQGYTTFAVGKMHFAPDAGPLCPTRADNRRAWEAGYFDDWHGPYYGFQHVAMSLGHHFPGGHYGLALKQKDPNLAQLFSRDRALRIPTGAPDSWVSPLAEEDHISWWVARETDRFLTQFQHEPFFGWISFSDPHHPFAPPEPYASMYDPADMPKPHCHPGELQDKPPHFRQYYEGLIPHEGMAKLGIKVSSVSDEQMGEITAHTYGMISLLDKAIGHILNRLTELDLDRNTLVILCSDHGELLGDHGLLFKGPFLYESVTKIPFIIRSPNHGAVRVTNLMSTVDIAPSLLRYMNIPIPEWMSGNPLPLFCEDMANSAKRSVLTEYRSSETWPGLQLKSVRTARYRLTKYIGQTEGELYDLWDDPYQFRNLYHDRDYQNLRLDLMEELVDCIGTIQRRYERRTAHA